MNNKLNVDFVGFGGGFFEYPCYKDENNNLYFDMNEGCGVIELYTGAYRNIDGDICGEPDRIVTSDITCKEPYTRDINEFDYMMLGRYKSDCDYFLGNGGGCLKYLYFGDIDKHCLEMEKILYKLPKDKKPEWLTLEQIRTYKQEMQKIAR